ncbi:MAG TPA: PQQ-binding-like beta-propeller repeat protein [Candidatus Binatia bacterium]|nr:PQQ-binding-like beta-propeller repeat protein [Candidatus Binatia bacterium]
MAILKKVQVTVVLALLLASSVFASIPLMQKNASAQVNKANASNLGNLDSYEWSGVSGDSSFTRFSAGPAPDTSKVLWKTNVTGIQPYIAAFDGLIFSCTNDSVVALDQTGKVVWKTPIPMNRTWPVAYKIDDSRLVVEGTCLDAQTGNILWTSSSFSADTGIFNANVYSPEEQMFYIKAGSYIEAWSFSDPSKPPTMIWRTYVPGGGMTGIGTTYGGGIVFPGSFENQQIALNAKTGAVLWTTLTKGPMIFSGSYSDGRFLRGGTDDNTIYCFNASNGQILWTYTPDTNGYFTVGSAVAYGMVYELNKDGYLYAINIETGKLVWEYKGPGPLIFPGAPTVADGKVYATTGQTASYLGQVGASQFACLSAYTGQVIWQLSMEALAPRESVAVAYGNLYFIPGDVTTSVDTISGTEYSAANQLWAIGTSSTSVSSWAMWGANPTHSFSAQTGPANLTLNWKFATQGSVISSPAVVSGIIYVGSQDKNIYAIGAWSGKLLWKFATNGAIESSLAVANGKVYTGGDDGYAYCLDAYTGALIWKTFINGSMPFTYATLVMKSSPTVSGSNVYIGSLDGYLYALDLANGNITWKTKTKGPIESTPAVVDGAIYITSQEPDSGALYKLDANTGAVIWNQSLPYEYVFTGARVMLGSVSVAEGMVFASGELKNYYGINATTGDIVWTFSDSSAIEFIVSAPIPVNGQVFIVDKFNIASLDATNGHTIWSAFTGDELYNSPSYADGKIYVVTSQRNIFVLDANNGTKIATATTPSSSWSVPVIANGRLYLGCNDWNVYSFSNSVTAQASNPTPTPTSTIIPALPDDMLILIVGLVVALVALAAVSYLAFKRKKKTAVKL